MGRYLMILVRVADVDATLVDPHDVAEYLLGNDDPSYDKNHRHRFMGAEWSTDELISQLRAGGQFS